ncbi:MAG TPA: peptidylprolyl isomerase [Chloroflexota bacterium]|nr:peptidylprolyl isomerase [Chloroflexota bacterium]
MSDEHDGDQQLDAAEDPTTTGPDDAGAQPTPRPVRRPRPAPGVGYGSGRRSRVESKSTFSPLVAPIFAVVALLALVAAIGFDHFHGTSAAAPTAIPAVPTSPPAPTAAPTATLVVMPTVVSSKPGLAAEVNGIKVSLKEFNQESAQLASSMQTQQSVKLTTPAGLKTYHQQQQKTLQSLIDTAYAVWFAQQHHLVATKAQVAALMSQYEQQAGGAAAFAQTTASEGFTQDVVSQIVADSATGSNVFNYVVKGLPCPCDLHVRHILLKANQQALADKLAKELQADHGSNFAALAKKYSTDTGSAVQGGDLGFISKGQTVAPFDKAAYSLKIDQISNPVKSTYGWHIIEVLGKRPASATAQPYYTKWLAKQEKTATVHTYVTIPNS